MVNTALFTNAPAEPRPVPALTAVVYHTEWNSFTQASHQTRYTIRWRHDLGILVLKVTDDVQCIKFKTRSGAFINRFEAFNLAMQTKMHGSEPPASVEAFPVAARDTPSNGAVQQLEVDAIGRLGTKTCWQSPAIASHPCGRL
ncbi:BQ2448_6978 [Microbotryum intermedium]|uniref:BQ2448_6978 protein n=1 Tax=Microbotryum intermedium TaxID=269621 RepID=A0A238FM03_9BASI|nr:BQ2448_6978 [Microbotryum intermedium]